MLYYSELLIFSVCNFTFQGLVSHATSHTVSHYCLRSKKPNQNLLLCNDHYVLLKVQPKCILYNIHYTTVITEGCLLVTVSTHQLYTMYFILLNGKMPQQRQRALLFTSEFVAQVISLHLKLLLKVLIPVYEVIINTYMDAKDFFMTISITIKIPTGMKVFGWLVPANSSAIK